MRLSIFPYRRSSPGPSGHCCRPGVDRHAVAAGNKADYIIARKRIAAAGELDKAVVYSLDYDALAALDALFSAE